MTSEAIMITGELNIKAVQLCAVKGALRLEALGMKRGGRSVSSIWAEQFGMPKRSGTKKVLERVEAELKKIDEQLGIVPA